MPQNKTIKFFISSTFKDFLKERNALQNFVFPRLKKLCQKDGFYFQPVDLRWGVTEESSEDNKTMEYCLNEVRRCSSDPKPNLLILFGQRYGWGPLPSFLRIDEWNYIKSNITKKELLHLEKWYIQDLNDKEEKFFLKEKKGLERKEWETIEKELKNIIQTATINKIDDKEYRRFHTSATEQEIRDALEKQYTAKNENTIVYFREFEKGAIDKDLIEDSSEDKEKLLLLKSDLEEKDLTSIKNKLVNLEKYKQVNDECKDYNQLSDELKYFCIKVLKEFSKNIKKEIKNYNEEHYSSLKVDLAEQERFLELKSHLVFGRDDEIKAIKNFVINSDQKFYLLYGKSGSGKTSVMARSICELVKLEKCQLDENTKVKNEDKFDGEFIYRFIGTTAHTTSPRDTYEHIYWQIIDQELDKKPKDIESDDQNFYQQFQKALEKYSKGEKLTLFIDAVDQFNGYDSLEIFLSYVPKNVKVIFSCLYDENKHDNEDYITYYNLLKHIENKELLGSLKSTDNNEILQSWLESSGRKLDYKIQNTTNPQWKRLINNCENKTPLYLRLSFEIVKEWKSTSDINECILEDREEKLIKQFFENVIKKHYVKRELLELSLGLISASKDGLSENELIEILTSCIYINKEGEYKSIMSIYEREGSSYPSLQKLPDAIFSKMYYHIQDVFTERLIDDEMLIKPFHRLIEETLKEYVYEINKVELHTKIVDYFEKYNNQGRRNRELPWSYYNLDNFDKLSKFLYDPFNMSTLYKEYKTDLFFYYNFLSKREENEQILEINFKLQEVALYLFNKNNKDICDDVSERALNIGLFYKDIAKYEYAKKIFLLGINSQGMELPNNMLSYVGVLVDLNQFEDALKVIDEFSTDKIKDSSFFISLNSLKAVIYKRLGKYDEALELYSNLNDDNLTILYNKAVLLKTSGQKEKSKEIFEDILSRSISDFEFKLRVQNSYASLLKQLGKIDEAYESLKKLYKDTIEYFPENHALLFSIGNNYSKVCIEVDDEEIKKESLKIQEKLLIRIRKVHGNSINEDGLLLKHNLSETNFILGKTLEAKNYAKEAYEGRRELFGIEHTDTILSLLSYFNLIIMEENFDKEILANYFKDLYLHRDLIHDDDKYDKEILNMVLQAYCDRYYDVSCQECNEIFFYISNHLKQQDNYEKAVDYDIKRFQCSISHLSRTKNYHNFVTVGTTLAGTYFKLNLNDKVIEVEKTIVDTLRSNYDYIFKEKKIFDITQFIKSIKNLSESLQDNGNTKEAIPYIEEVLELRYKLAPKVTKTLDLSNGDVIDDDVYGIYKIELDEYIDSINQLATFIYKNDLLDLAERTQQKAIDECIKYLEKDYDKYLQKALDYYSDLASMFLMSSLATSKIKYKDALTFVQNELENNKINKEVCIKKQESILNGIKLLLSHVLDTDRKMALNFNRLLIDLYIFLCTIDEESWIDKLIEEKKIKVKLLKDNKQLEEAIEHEREVGKYLLEYKYLINNWQDKMILHLNNLATGYYNLNQFEGAIENAYKLINFFDESNITKDVRYENAQSIINLINQKKQQENGLNNFIIKDSQSRDEFVKVLFLLEESLSDDELKSLLNDNNFTEDTPYDYCIVKSSTEINFIQEYYGEDIELPALVYYLDGEIEFIKGIYHDSDEETSISELLELFSNLSTSKYNEPLTTLLHIAKGLSIKYNNSEEIRVSELFNALHSVELSPQAEELFRQVFGDRMDQINEDTDGHELVELANQHDKINYDEQMKNLVQQLKEVFGDDLILNIR